MRPTYKDKSIRMNYVEKSPHNYLFSGDIFSISQLAYKAYGNLIGAEIIRKIEPMNQKLIKHYTSEDGGLRLIATTEYQYKFICK